MNTEEAIVVGIIIFILLCLLLRGYCTIVYRFYRPTCQYCVISQAEWNSFKNRCLFSMIRTKEVNLDDNSDYTKRLTKKFKVESVPTVIKIDADGALEVYDGPRTADAYMIWASS